MGGEACVAWALNITMAAQPEEKITACRNANLNNWKSSKDTAAPPTLRDWQLTDNTEVFHDGRSFSDSRV